MSFLNGERIAWASTVFGGADRTRKVIALSDCSLDLDIQICDTPNLHSKLGKNLSGW